MKAPKFILGNICTVVDCEHKTAPHQTSGIPLIRTPNIGHGVLLLENVQRVSKETYAQWTRRAEPAPGDLIMAREAPVGNVAIVPKNQQVCLGQRTVLIRVSDPTATHAGYLNYLLNSPQMQAHLISLSNGATVGHLNVRDIRRLSLPPLPLFSTQKKIAAILSAYDELIENNRQRIALLERMAEEIYREWFVRMRFPGHEDVRIVKGVPEGWEVVGLDKVSKNFDSRRIPLSGQERAKMQGSIPYYGAAKIMDFVSHHLFEGQHLLVAEDGSVITPEGYPVLQLADGKFWVNNHAHVLKGIGEYSTEWLYLALQRYPVSGLVTGAAQPKITQGNLNRILLYSAGKELMEKFNNMVKPLFALRSSLNRINLKINTTRDLLLPRLISGKLSVEDLDIAFPPGMRGERGEIEKSQQESPEHHAEPVI